MNPQLVAAVEKIIWDLVENLIKSGGGYSQGRVGGAYIHVNMIPEESKVELEVLHSSSTCYGSGYYCEKNNSLEIKESAYFALKQLKFRLREGTEIKRVGVQL